MAFDNSFDSKKAISQQINVLKYYCMPYGAL